MRHRPLALLLLTLPLLTACIEDRLTVELHTQVHLDGTCTRRVAYVLERIDTDRAGARVDFTAEDSPLRRLHRFPTGEAWRIDEELQDGSHRVVLDATLESPNDFDGDFFRARRPSHSPARNYVSAYVSPEDGVYEYSETFRDPVSPVASVRALARDVVKRDRDFSRLVLEALGAPPASPRPPDLQRAYLELFAEPFAADVGELSRRPVYGPRERRALDRALEDVETRQGDLRAAVRALAPAAPPDDLDQAVDAALDALAESLLSRAEDAGLPLFPGGSRTRINFRATLVLPYPITRANTCALGDTAIWEFTGEELYGRGFEMMALATAP